MGGYEGITGVPVVLGALQTSLFSLHADCRKRAQDILGCSAQSHAAHSETMRDYLLLYDQAQIVQTTSTALANSEYLVEARLAR